MSHVLYLLSPQVSLFTEAGLPFKALPFKAIEKGDKIVYRVPDMDVDVLVETYWYGTVGLMTKSGSHWIKFYDIEDNSYISEEKHPMFEKDYYDRWMFVERDE